MSSLLIPAYPQKLHKELGKITIHQKSTILKKKYQEYVNKIDGLQKNC
nr:hypothetical protein [Escherichia coli]